MTAENHSSKHYLQCCLIAICWKVQYSPLQQKNKTCQKNCTSNHILPQWRDKTKVAPWLPCSFCRQRIKEIWSQGGLRNKLSQQTANHFESWRFQFSGMMPCSLVHRHESFRGACCHHLQGSTSLISYARRLKLSLHICENLISCVAQMFFLESI